MGILGAAGQLFNTVRKAPIAGKFMQRTGNFLQRNFNPVSAQGYKQSLRNLGPKGRANLSDINRTGLRELGDGVRSVSAMPTVRNIGRGLMGVGIADSLRKGDYGAAATEAALFSPGRTIGALKTVGRLAAPLVGPAAGALTKAGLLFAAAEGLAPARAATGRLDEYYKTLTPEQKKKFEAETRSQQENMSDAQKRKMGITAADPLVTRLPSDEDLTPPIIDENLTPPTIIEEPVLSSSSNLPSSPEAVVANPLQQKMAEYEQGRAKATTQEEMNAVRDLGMSIHQAANPQMYEESYNPLMAATFPERYTKTPEDFIVQGGIQAPRSMTEKDAAQATAFGNKVQNIENLDVNPMYNPFEAAEEQSRLDKALAAVIASRRFNP